MGKKYLSGAFLKAPDVLRDSKGLPHHVEIWRIEQFKVKFWPRDQFGSFHQGDSYIILHTWLEDDKILFDLHFWIGSESTQDEYGTAAYETVELDTLLDDIPVQKRETEGNESPEFVRIFTEIIKSGGIRYLEGGAATGFRHVKPEEHKPRLLHLKGNKKMVRVKQVDVSCSSLNSGDLFVLDLGHTLYCWTGKSAGMFERNKGRELCSAIDQERRGKAKVINVREDDGEEDDDLMEFYNKLDGSPADIKTAEGGGDDNAPKAKVEKKLFRVSDASGTLQFSEEASGAAVTKDKLDSSDAFILDAGYAVFIWLGKNCTEDEKKGAMENATKYLKDVKGDTNIPVTRYLDGGERTEFWQQFNG